jgi:hypothetical protein
MGRGNLPNFFGIPLFQASNHLFMFIQQLIFGLGQGISRIRKITDGSGGADQLFDHF